MLNRASAIGCSCAFRTEGERDFSDLLREQGRMVRPLRDPAYFVRVFLEFGAPAWPNGLDLAPAALHSEMAAGGLLRRPDAA
jgi:hypothetical protein